MELKFIEKTIEESFLMMEKGSGCKDILTHLIYAAESISGNKAVSSILVLDHNGLLRNGASPGLPDDYLKAIDRLKPDANLGTCASAAATGKMVITTDFMADNKWAELKHLPLSLGFEGAWSMPIKDDSGKVLGTFGTYFVEKRKPTPEEIESIKLLSMAAARVIKNKPIIFK